ncbi:MAG: amidohydrolase [Acidimicrobiia bacterium]
MPADRIFRNGRVFTGDPSAPHAGAIAVGGGKVLAVGEEGDVHSLRGPGTEVIDLEGRLLTPGFIDAHAHPGTSGLDRLRVDFERAQDAAGAVEAVSLYAAENPGLAWIVGSGWSQAWFQRGCPDKDLLDGAVPDRPVLLWNSDGHGAWANRAALQLAGIDASTPDPPNGRIERNPDGTPQGTLHEAAVELVERHAPVDTVGDFVLGLVRGQEEFLSLGITGWQDAGVRPDLHQAYLELSRSGRLRGRVVGALWWEHDRGEEQIDELIERRDDAGPRFRPTSVKLMLDGVAENFTASVLEPWLGADGEPTHNRGIDFIDPTALRELVTRLDAEGFQCHFHAIGDRAVRSALDAIEEALTRNGRSDNRHHIAHIQVVHPDDIPRFARLDAVANAQPFWARHEVYQDELTIPFLGGERAPWQYPFGSLLRAGARLAMGSDWGVTTANVMEEVEVAVTRRWGREKTFFPDELITPEQALTAFTSGSAFVNHADEVTGRLLPGMLADLVVLDRDPLSEGSFRHARVDLTMIGGEAVFERARC